ncbi:MAG: DUF5399 family protein [Verrucomicrobia bacterium]|nr:DUF5399 family protein [Verrucomicrobiota bacterium]
MAEPKIVSNLPADVSTRWATDQKLLEETRPFITESNAIPLHAQKDVIFPTLVSEVSLLMGLQWVHPTWAMFNPPAGYQFQWKRLFTNQVAPKLGSDEQLEDKIQKVTAVKDKNEEDKRDQEALIKLLKLLQELDSQLTFAISRRSQYHKG